MIPQYEIESLTLLLLLSKKTGDRMPKKKPVLKPRFILNYEGNFSLIKHFSKFR